MKSYKKNIVANTWIVIPGYNESRYVRSVLTKILKKTSRVIFVDDGSEDDTAQKVRAFPVELLTHEINLGKGAALKTGCDYAFDHMGAKAVILMDADNQHNPKKISAFKKELKKGREVVLGVRKLSSDMPSLRKLGNIVASWSVALLFGKYIPDVLSGYKALTKQVYKTIRWKASDYGVELELATQIARYGIDFSVVNIETIYHDLDRGMNIFDAAKVAFALLRLRLDT